MTRIIDTIIPAAMILTALVVALGAVDAMASVPQAAQNAASHIVNGGE